MPILYVAEGRGGKEKTVFSVRECEREFLLPPSENLGRFVYGGL